MRKKSKYASRGSGNAAALSLFALLFAFSPRNISARDYTSDELLIARVICAEEENYRGMYLRALEILERVASPLWGDSVAEVVYTEGEYPHFLDGVLSGAGESGYEAVERYQIALRAAADAGASYRLKSRKQSSQQ